MNLGRRDNILSERSSGEMVTGGGGGGDRKERWSDQVGLGCVAEKGVVSLGWGLL